VLTAHPTQIVRRALQHKHCSIARLLQEADSLERTALEKEETVTGIVREVMALWQTDELRRSKPTPVDEARVGLHVVEQSLWAAVPQFLRRLSASLRNLSGHDIPINCSPIHFSSWMGGDRDGNPNVTAAVRLGRVLRSHGQLLRALSACARAGDAAGGVHVALDCSRPLPARDRHVVFRAVHVPVQRRVVGGGRGDPPQGGGRLAACVAGPQRAAE